MFTQSQQTSTLKVIRWPRSLTLALKVGGSIVGLVVVGLLAGLIWIQSSVRYPGAERQAAAEFQLQFGPIGNVSQQAAFQTPDDLTQVLAWYTQHFGLSHDMPQGESCVTMTGAEAHLLLRQSVTVTLCDQQTRTLIFIDRDLTVR
jgi:hypothetical protein